LIVPPPSEAMEAYVVVRELAAGMIPLIYRHASAAGNCPAIRVR